MSGLPLVAVGRATLCCGEQAAHCGGFSCRRAQAVGAQADLLYMGSGVGAHRLTALQRVESSQIRARARVPCVSRWIRIHCTARKVQ